MTNSLVDDVVGVVGVSDGVGASQQHLERNVGDQLTQFCSTLPRTLVQEPHRHVERRAYTEPQTTTKCVNKATEINRIELY